MPLVWSGSAWLIGLVLAALAPLEVWQWSILAILAALSAILFRSLPPHRSLFLLLCALFLGAARWTWASPRIDQEHAAYYADTTHELQLTGTIAADPDIRDASVLVELEVERIWIPALAIQRNVEGRVLVVLSSLTRVQYGERLRISGMLETPPQQGDFSYRDYLALQDIHAWVPEAYPQSLGMGPTKPAMRGLMLLRRSAFDQVQRLFPYPEAPLIAGILLGIEGYIPETLAQSYSATGTTHIIAISGFNITIVAGLTITLFGRIFGRTRGLWIACVVITAYTVFVGGDAPVVRASIMGSVALLARYLGRRTHGLTSLVVAAMLMTLIDPHSMLDVGFQLSFLATLGLILYAEPMTRITTQLITRFMPGAEAKIWTRLLGEMLLFTLAAQITTLPIIVWNFHQLSLTSLLANALILPLQPFLMIFSGLATCLGLIWHPLGQVIALVAWPFSALTNQIVTTMASIPGGVLYAGRINITWLFTYYLVLLTLTFWVGSTSWHQMRSFVQRRFSQNVALARNVSLLALLLANLIVWHRYLHRPDGYMHVIVLDVDQGEAILVQTPSGGTLLANGGSSPVGLATALGHTLRYPYKGIDWLLIAGSHYAQLAGLRDLPAMGIVDQVLYSGKANSAVHHRLLKDFRGARVPLWPAQAGHSLDLGHSITLEVITSGPHGMTFLLNHGSARVLLLIGLSPSEIAALMDHKQLSSVTAIVLAAGGYEAVNPTNLNLPIDSMIHIVSCRQSACPENGQSHPEILNQGSASLSTSRYGSIEIITDGQDFWLMTEFEPDSD